MAQILLVEPDTILADIYTEALSKQGDTVYVAKSAQQAVLIADKKRMDVVVLELQLAHHNGIEFLYELRSHADFSNIPVIIHSNVPPLEIGMTADLQFRLGVEDILYKPATTLERLCDAVNTVIKEAGHAQH